MRLGLNHRPYGAVQVDVNGSILAVMADQQTIEQARGGDVAAFGRLYSEYEGRIYGLALRMLLDPARAEDATQEVFVRAWRKMDRFSGRSAFYTWLYRLAVNVILNEIRRHTRQPEPVDASGGALDHAASASAAPTSSPVAALDLEKAITALPRQGRLVFWLHDVEGYRHREIAEMLGIAAGTSKAHLHRARLRLREELTR